MKYGVKTPQKVQKLYKVLSTKEKKHKIERKKHASFHLIKNQTGKIKLYLTHSHTELYVYDSISLNLQDTQQCIKKCPHVYIQLENKSSQSLMADLASKV